MVNAELIGRRVRQRRRTQGMTVTRLAKASNIARSTVQRIESGRATPSDETLGALASALEIPVGELTKPSEARVRVAPPRELNGGVPMSVVRTLCTGRLGRVSRRELDRLINNSKDPEFGADAGLLELELLFRRACSAMHDRSLKDEFDEAFERIRSEMLHARRARR